MKFDIAKLTEDELMLASSLSKASSPVEKYMVLLFFLYGLTLTRKELGKVLKLSDQSIERRIKEGLNIPEYIKSSKGKKSSYFFTIYSVAEYLSNTVKIA
jgi:Fic family protein